MHHLEGKEHSDRILAMAWVLTQSPGDCAHRTLAAVEAVVVANPPDIAPEVDRRVETLAEDHFGAVKVLALDTHLVEDRLVEIDRWDTRRTDDFVEQKMTCLLAFGCVKTRRIYTS